MAWVFSLSIECGDDREAAGALAAAFDGRALSTSGGQRLPCTTSQSVDAEGAAWVMVAPQGVTQSGVRDEADRLLLNELGQLLYGSLKEVTQSYRFALVGVEVDHFATYADLVSERPKHAGLVVSEALWHAMGDPPDFVAFAAGHRWIPWAGA